METLKAIQSRRSYRGNFTAAAIPREDMREILKAGVSAPSGCNLQTTEFIGVDDPELARALGRAYGRAWAETAPAAVVLLTKEYPQTPGGTRHVEDFSAAAQNILLALTDMGYAGVWIEGQIAGEPAAAMAELLHVPPELTVAVYIPFGVPADTEVKEVKKKAFEERAWFNRHP